MKSLNEILNEFSHAKKIIEETVERTPDYANKETPLEERVLGDIIVTMVRDGQATLDMDELKRRLNAVQFQLSEDMDVTGFERVKAFLNA